jgi:uncharacterized protein
MTPQEAQLVDDLFDRLARLESAPRDAAAERLVSDGLQRAPHAVYALVQTALVQDEALKRANARIEELQAQTADAEAAEQRPASFLDTMRQAVTGRAAARGSVPRVRAPMPGTQPQNLQSAGAQPENFQPQGGQPQGGYPPPPPSGYPGGAPFSPGGSFLGNAASTAAGVIGGSLLLNSIRSAFGSQVGSFGSKSSGGTAADSTSPWSKAADPSAGTSDLGRDLGADKAGDQAGDARNDPSGDVESVADTDDEYDADDDDEAGDDDFDDADSDDDSYDV